VRRHKCLIVNRLHRCPSRDGLMGLTRAPRRGASQTCRRSVPGPRATTRGRDAPPTTPPPAVGLRASVPNALPVPAVPSRAQMPAKQSDAHSEAEEAAPRRSAEPARSPTLQRRHAGVNRRRTPFRTRHDCPCNRVWCRPNSMPVEWRSARTRTTACSYRLPGGNPHLPACTRC
jgi:hypothetical protein